MEGGDAQGGGDAAEGQVLHLRPQGEEVLRIDSKAAEADESIAEIQASGILSSFSVGEMGCITLWISYCGCRSSHGRRLWNHVHEEEMESQKRRTLEGQEEETFDKEGREGKHHDVEAFYAHRYRVDRSVHAFQFPAPPYTVTQTVP